MGSELERAYHRVSALDGKVLYFYDDDLSYCSDDIQRVPRASAIHKASITYNVILII